MVSKITCSIAILGLLAMTAHAGTLYEEHFVDSLGANNPSWHVGQTNTAQEITWPIGSQDDWTPGLNINSSDIGWAHTGGGGGYSTCISNQYGTWDPHNWGNHPGQAASPDGDDWHFFGMHDGGDGMIYTLEYNSVDPITDVTFSMNFGTANAGNGIRQALRVDGAWYMSDVLGGGAVDSGGIGHGSVQQWASANTSALDTWYPYNGDALAGVSDANLGAAGTLPDGVIDAVGVFRNDHGKIAVDNVVLSGSVVPEPTSLILLCSGLFGLFAFGWRKR